MLELLEVKTTPTGFEVCFAGDNPGDEANWYEELQKEDGEVIFRPLDPRKQLRRGNEYTEGRTRIHYGISKTFVKD